MLKTHVRNHLGFFCYRNQISDFHHYVRKKHALPKGIRIDFFRFFICAITEKKSIPNFHSNH